MIKYLLIVSSVMLFACKGDNVKTESKDQIIQEDQNHEGHNHEEQKPQEYNVDFNRNVEDLVYNTPDPTSFFTQENIEGYLGLNPGDIYDVVANGKVTDRSRSVFYKVSDPEKGNAAVLVRTISNPYFELAKKEDLGVDFVFEKPGDELPFEFKEWASTYIRNKITEGEHSLNDPNKTVIYDKWDMGVSGAMHEEDGSYYWRDKSGVVYHIAFNLTSSKNQRTTAEKLAKMITP